MPIDPNPSTDPAQPHEATEANKTTLAARRVQADVDAVPDDDLEPINREIVSVVSTVIGAAIQLEKFLPQLATMPGFDIDHARKLTDFAYALEYWNACAAYSVPPKPELVAMVERAVTLRERTLHDLGALVRHGLLPSELTKEFGGSVAYRKVAHDLIGLSNLVHERWATIGGKTLITLEAMDQASDLGADILRDIGVRDLSQAELALAVIRKQKAYTLVVRTYSEIRSAMGYIRRVEGDAEKFAPTLYAGSERRPKDATDAKAGASSQSGAAPAPTLGAPRSNLIEVEDTAST